jgi:caspase domain-containing protein
VRTVPCIFMAVLFLFDGAAIAGVRRPPRDPAAGEVEPMESAAVFVGIREFTYDSTLTEVPYAVDDAIDLAYVLAGEGKTHLVPPDRIILALSGQPQKPSSRLNLDALIAAGASVREAGQSDILTILEAQSRAVGTNGILIVSFATHGVSEDGAQYLLTAHSLVHHRETTIAESTVQDIITQAGVPRSLILLDACRQNLTSGRTGGADPRSAAGELQRVIGDVTGQVVFSAAAAGEYAYDDDVRGNGVFTAAVIDGLRCGASTDSRGFVTVETLSAFIEDRVLSWVQKHRDPDIRRATQLQFEGRAKTMPLSTCGNRTQ